MVSNLTNIEEYYRESEHNDIDFEEFKKMCSSPFIFVKEMMSSGLLRDIRLQYFGVFKVSPSRVEFSKKALKVNLEKGVISQERYDRKMKILNNYEA